ELLYQYDFYDEKINLESLTVQPDSLAIFNEIILQIEFIDDIIERNLFDYSINRLNKVDRAIIRLATYELTQKELPHAIIINEAIELTKEYSNLDDGKQHRFTNKLLDQIYQDIQSE
ncbi:MAG: transcription antitermination protein NusB, partial [Candidatus Phytoplasma sp.]|nr:transcription antitermination protein NusB [Phytoplasma sp.]